MNIRRVLAGFALLLSTPAASWATCTSLFGHSPSYNVEVCINYTPDYADEGVGEDYWTSSSARSAQGVRIKIWRPSNGFVLFGGSNGDYVGADGCVTLAGPIYQGPYTIRVFSQAKIVEGANANYIDVRASTSNDDRFYRDVSTNFSPTSNLTCTYTWNNSSAGTIEGGGAGTTSDVVNILAGVSFSLGQHDGGLASKTFKVFNQVCPGGSGSCTASGTSSRVDMFLSSEGRTKKFIVAHETGHGVHFLKDEGYVPNTSSSESDDPCDRDDDGSPASHTLVSKESQGMAATEGFAHFWSAAVWNSRAGGDCRFKYYKSVDLDQDGTEETWENDTTISCLDSLHPGDYPHYDYLHAKCSTSFAGKATEYDWMRALANMYMADDEYYLTTTEVADIWDGADGYWWTSDAAPPSIWSPYQRLSDSAEALLDYDDELVWYWYSTLHGVDE